ncbi:MAG: TolC family protein, partial [Aquificota bacterium]
MRLFLFIVLFVGFGYALSLEEAINLALKNHTSVRLSELDIKRAE